MNFINKDYKIRKILKIGLEINGNIQKLDLMN